MVGQTQTRKASSHRQQNSFVYRSRGGATLVREARPPTGPHPLGHKHSAHATEDPRAVLRSLIARTNSTQPSPSYEHARVPPGRREIHNAHARNPHRSKNKSTSLLSLAACLIACLSLTPPHRVEKEKRDNSKRGEEHQTPSSSSSSSKGNNKSRRHQIEKVFI